jgi:hypothetical protein
MSLRLPACGAFVVQAGACAQDATNEIVAATCKPVTPAAGFELAMYLLKDG